MKLNKYGVLISTGLLAINFHAHSCMEPYSYHENAYSNEGKDMLESKDEFALKDVFEKNERNAIKLENAKKLDTKTWDALKHYFFEGKKYAGCYISNLKGDKLPLIIDTIQKNSDNSMFIIHANIYYRFKKQPDANEFKLCGENAFTDNPLEGCYYERNVDGKTVSFQFRFKRCGIREYPSEKNIPGVLISRVDALKSLKPSDIEKKEKDRQKRHEELRKQYKELLDNNPSSDERIEKTNETPKTVTFEPKVSAPKPNPIRRKRKDRINELKKEIEVFHREISSQRKDVEAK